MHERATPHPSELLLDVARLAYQELIQAGHLGLDEIYQLLEVLGENLLQKACRMGVLSEQPVSPTRQ